MKVLQIANPLIGRFSGNASGLEAILSAADAARDRRAWGAAIEPNLEVFRHRFTSISVHSFAQSGNGWGDVVAAFGTDALSYLDFQSIVGPLTREMAETQQLGEDWLVCVDFARVDQWGMLAVTQAQADCK